MDIGVPFKRLGKVDVAPLRDAILGTQESVWYLDDTRQRDYVVHLDTQSIVLLFCEGWPAIKVKRKSGWDLFSQQAMPIMADLLKPLGPFDILDLCLDPHGAQLGGRVLEREVKVA